MKSTNKRLVSILLCLAMVLAVLPMAVSAASTTTLYCAAPSSWTNCSVYWWGSSSSTPDWPGEAMTKGADGIWYHAVPSDAGNVIFNNGSAQTSDLIMPTDDKIQWNYEAKEWVTCGSEVEEVETVDVRFISHVDSLDYSEVLFYITIGDETATVTAPRSTPPSMPTAPP